ncbi:exo-beta-N-acetylmuramidase NamZ family protein [Dictyobacter aurantiacus]|uniref:DUF1343 domain-containing protein n=1 Tax=Dictyobacter aurantiacus TaxID=1936993 RepID=A0A401Z8P1_9CHLR|nr:DUF1343 domain-containing protein [Dictyobacter aurantiacus]GCE03188.1 hypothetical protein KDAU_05170 [Dictyobacter aurantiacus]
MRQTRAHVESGLEVFLATDIPQLAGKRAGLLTNATGIDRRFRNTVDLLQAHGKVELCALFGPEHGIRGDMQAGVKVAGQVDQRTGLPMYSLYGETRRPDPEMLAGLDLLIYDMQDLGARYSTYIATLQHAQQAAAQAELTFVVLDRPNPLGGNRVAGNILDNAFNSFVGCHPLPIQHGMTSGELARLFAANYGWPEPLVVPMHGWRRSLRFEETDLPWVQPTPNLPTLDSIKLYPGTCLVEGTPCSEGRGTTRPFELIGAPDLDPFALAEELDKYQLPGVAFRPTYFTPTFSKHAQQICGGIQVHIVEPDLLQPVEMGIYLIYGLHKFSPAPFNWISGAEGKHFIDLLYGSNALRLALDGGAEVPDILATWEPALTAFQERRRPFLLYGAEEE